MSIAAPQADAFFKEVIINNAVWAICDEGGFPTSTNASGETAMPFWSKENRVQTVIKNVPAYKDFKAESIPMDKFIQNWLPGLKKDGLFVGVNWSGERAMGYDMDPMDVLAGLSAMDANGS